MKVVLEVFDFDVDKKSLIGPVELAKRYAAEIDAKYDNFGLMVDLSHLPLLHETAVQSLIESKTLYCSAHLGNCRCQRPVTSRLWRCASPVRFSGWENDVEELVHFEYLRVLLSIGFLNKEKRPIVSFEVKPFGDEDPDLVVSAKRV